MTKQSLLTLTACLVASASSTSCYFLFDEELHETDIHGTVVIEAEAYGLSSFNDLSAEELQSFINRLGMVYIGAYSGLESRQGMAQPTFDPVTQDAFPYGGGTVGVYEYLGQTGTFLGCDVVSGRFTDIPELLTHFDVREQPDGELMSRYQEYRSASSDGVISTNEAEALNLSSQYPVISEAEFVSSLLEEDYFRYYQPQPSAGCTYDEDGDLVLESCGISDFDFVGNIPWTVNGDGNLEAPFTIYKVFTPLDENGEEVYPALWAWVDQDATSCYLWTVDFGTSDGETISRAFPQSVEYTMNYTCEAVSEGDLITNFDDVSTAPRANEENVVLRLNAVVPELTEDQLTYTDDNGITRSYGYPFCKY